MFEALKAVGHRPEMFRSIAGKMALTAGANHLGEELKNGAEDIKERMWGGDGERVR